MRFINEVHNKVYGWIQLWRRCFITWGKMKNLRKEEKKMTLLKKKAKLKTGQFVRYSPNPIYGDRQWFEGKVMGVFENFFVIEKKNSKYNVSFTWADWLSEDVLVRL